MMVSQAQPVTLFICELALFLAAIIHLVFVPQELKTRHGLMKTVIDIIFIGGYLTLTVIVEDIWYQTYFENPGYIGLDVSMSVLCGGAIFASLETIFRVVILLVFQKKTISSNSIKEAIDALPIGICYFSLGGKAVLVNVRMYELYQYMSVYALHSYVEFKRNLLLCERESSQVRKLSPDSNIYLFPNNQQYRYSQRTIYTPQGDCYIEALFTDVTALHNKQQLLEQQAGELNEVSQNIRTLSQNAVSLTKERELTAAKITLHNQMGAALTTMRRYLDDDMPSEYDDIAPASLRNAVHAVFEEMSIQADDEDLESIIRDAAFVQVKVNITGVLPAAPSAGALDDAAFNTSSRNDAALDIAISGTSDPNTRRLFVSAIRECLTNAVRHAQATQLDVQFDEIAEDGMVYDLLRVVNNGIAPKHDIVLSGGLRNIAGITKQLSGTMLVETHEHFALVLKIPKRKEVRP